METLVGVAICFNLELFIDWPINSYFNWSYSGVRVETTAEDFTVKRSTNLQSVSGPFVLKLNVHAILCFWNN